MFAARGLRVGVLDGRLGRAVGGRGKAARSWMEYGARGYGFTSDVIAETTRSFPESRRDEPGDGIWACVH